MKNQFAYTRIDGEKSYIDTFNIDKVIRSVAIEDGKRIVLLDDLHERWQDVPVHNKQGKVTAYKKDKNTYQSEVFLEPNDSERFVKLMSIE